MPVNKKIPKNCRHGSSHTRASVHAAAKKHEDALNRMEAELDKYTADIALIISDMFKFMSISSAVLPNMKLDTDMKALCTAVKRTLSHGTVSPQVKIICHACRY